MVGHPRIVGLDRAAEWREERRKSARKIAEADEATRAPESEKQPSAPSSSHFSWPRRIARSAVVTPRQRSMAIPSAMSATGLAKAEPGASTCLSSSTLAGLAQSVEPFDLVLGQSADARMRAAGSGDGDRQHDLTGARRVGDAHLHAVEMAPDKGGVLVAERHIESDARAAPLLGRGNEGSARAQNLAHLRAEFGVQNCGGVFELAVLADGRRLAVAFRGRS